MIILGLNVEHADTSACIIVDGEIKNAIEEERFVRLKHYSGFPVNSIKFCLKENNLSLDDVDYIAVNFNLFYNFRHKFNFGLKNIHRKNLIEKLKKFLLRNKLDYYFKKYFNKNFSKKIVFVPHHLSHILSTSLFFGVKEGLGFSFDGSGDFSTIEIYDIKQNKYQLIEKILYPHSLGIFYQAFTQFLGFKKYGDEFKVMGLASYGKPIYIDRIKRVINKNPKNFFSLNLKYFNHQNSIINYKFKKGTVKYDNLYSKKLEFLFGKSRKNNEKITQFHKDLAASMQKVFIEIVVDKIEKLKKKSNHKNLILAGGCAFNSSLNGFLIKKNNFKKIFLSPNVGDAGGAIGAALYMCKQKGEKIVPNISPFLGTKYNNIQVEHSLKRIINKKKYKIEFFHDFSKITKKTAKLISENKIVAWFQDKMEWGPRALGNRSILADPRNSSVKDLINLKIKRREDFRPFAPSVLKEKANKYFYINGESPYMTAVYDVKKKAVDEIPGVVHIDKSSRVQTVDYQFNRKFYLLIKEFENLTNIPVILNTSLNVDEPICESPNDAINFFEKTSVDALVLQNWLILKK